jgi:hypothetical protein
MLDTIRVKFPVAPTDFQLGAWTRKTSTTNLAERVSYIYNPKIGATIPRFTYFPEAYNGFPMLTLEVSLPKFIFGKNYQMVNNIEEAIQLANSELAKIPDIPKLDLAEGVLIRLDMCYNHQVGDAVDDYIRAIGNLEYPHRRTKFHLGEGSEFRAKHKTTKFYNKEHESGYIEAHGILRQEITMIKGKDIQKFLGVKNPTLLNVTREQVKQELESDLEKLGLLNNSIANRNTAFETLSDTYGEHAGVYYFGYLVSKTQKSRKRIAKESKMHPRSIDRKLKKIVDVGIPLTLTDREEPLPPLEIRFDDLTTKLET